MAINENSPRYRCCCGGCRAIVGANVVAIFEALVGVVFLIFAIVFHRQGNQGQGYYSVVSAIFYIIAVMLLVFAAVLVIGICWKNRWFLILHMIKSGIAFGLLLGVFGMLIMAFVTVAGGTLAMDAINRQEGKEYFAWLTMISTVAIAAVSIYIILQIWFVIIVLAAYRAIHDSDAPVAMVVVSQQPPTAVIQHTTTAPAGAAYRPNVYQSTTYYPNSGGPHGEYPEMNIGYPTAVPSAPPPYSETEKV